MSNLSLASGHDGAHRTLFVKKWTEYDFIFSVVQCYSVIHTNVVLFFVHTSDLHEIRGGNYMEAYSAWQFRLYDVNIHFASLSNALKIISTHKTTQHVNF